MDIDTNGTVSVNGKTLKEPYVYQQLCPCDTKSITLQPNEYYVLGDHRGDSDDSRDWGPVPRKGYYWQGLTRLLAAARYSCTAELVGRLRQYPIGAMMRIITDPSRLLSAAGRLP